MKLSPYEALRYAICECYAWPVIVPIYQDGGARVQGSSCGRCHTAPILLSPYIDSIEEARVIFFENYKREVTPIERT